MKPGAVEPGAVDPAAGALRWVAEVLGDARIPFVVVGEAASVGHGAVRAPSAAGGAPSPAAGVLPPAAGAPALADGIEFFVAAADLPRLLRLVAAQIVEPPWRRRDERWDRVAAVLEHEHTRITVSVREAARVRDAATGAWVDAPVDLDASVQRTVQGVTLPVLAWERLVELERRLGRTPARRPAGRSAGGEVR